MKRTAKKPAWAVVATRKMKAEKITQDDLVSVFDVKTRGAVGHYFTGRREPSLKQLKNLAEKLGMTIGELTDDTSENAIAESNASYNVSSTTAQFVELYSKLSPENKEHIEKSIKATIALQKLED